MKRRMLELNQLKDNTKIVLGGFEMKKKAMALVMVAATAISLMAGSLSVSAATDPDTSAEKKIKVLSIWAEDSADGKILTGILDNYIKDVNPNFSYEYEYVSSSDLSTKVSTLVASNDLPDLFAYSAGVPLRELIQAKKVVNISEELKGMGDEDKVMDSAKSIMTSLSDTDDLYDLPFGMNIEGMPECYGYLGICWFLCGNFLRWSY